MIKDTRYIKKKIISKCLIVFFSVRKKKIISSDKRILECDECDYVAAKHSYLKRHKESKHEGVRYQCEQCDVSTTTKGDLSRHRRSKHEGIKYPCDQCAYSATTSSDLKQHKDAKHEGLR